MRWLKGANWLWTRSTGVALFGFALNLVGLIGSALYLEPARSAENSASLDALQQAARSRMMLAADGFDELAMHMGGLVFGVGLPPDAPDAMRDTLHDIHMREIGHRHDGVRGYIAQLGVAGALDFPTASRDYEALVAAEQANFNFDTYQAANKFEGDLSTAMVKTQGEAAMKAITLQGDRTRAKQIANSRELALLAISLTGSTILFLATMAGAAKPAPRRSGATARLTLALARLRAARHGTPA
jgi:hypothetical protein